MGVPYPGPVLLSTDRRNVAHLLTHRHSLGVGVVGQPIGVLQLCFLHQAILGQDAGHALSSPAVHVVKLNALAPYGGGSAKSKSKPENRIQFESGFPATHAKSPQVVVCLSL